MKVPSTSGAIERRLQPAEKSLGEFSVRRVLPSIAQKAIGPFVFFDHMGPAEFLPGNAIQVRPHPHIGIATITYLFEGEFVHRDSLGVIQTIQPGAVNLMTAGRGIVHSERGEKVPVSSRLHGIQSWIALPDEAEEMEPAFAHYPAIEIPQIDVDGVTVRVIIGAAFGQCSPVKAYSPMLYMECLMPAGSRLTLPDSHPELAAYIVSGEVHVDGDVYSAGVMAVATAHGTVLMQAKQGARVIVIGGAPVGERHLWWNFVSSSKQRLEQAKQDWRQGRFAMVADDDEFIPLPD